MGRYRAAALLLLWSSPVRADQPPPNVRVEYTAPVTPEAPAVKKSVAEVDRRSKELRTHAAEPQRDENYLHSGATAIFERLNERGSEKVVAPALQGWQKPDQSTTGTMDGMLDVMFREVSRFKSFSEAPPPPGLAQAYAYGRQMRDTGLMKYTDALNDNQLGVYVYTKSAPVGIFLNKMFFKLQSVLGDAFAAATTVHESAHSRDHAQGRLNPKEVIKGETLAYETEYWWMKTIDPKGQKLAWARVTFCTAQGGLPEKDKDVCEFLEHIARIMHYGNNDDFVGLVKSLGYRDRATDPFGSAEMMGYCPYHGRLEGS